MFAKENTIEYQEITATKQSHVTKLFDSIPQHLLNVNTLNKQIDMKYHSVEQIIQWTGKKFGANLFDTEYDEWTTQNCSLCSIINGKSQLLFFFSDGKYKFGCYIDTQIDIKGKPIIDQNMFLF